MSLQFHETQAVSRSIRPVTVVQVAAAVFVLQLAWERLVRASAAERRRLLTVIVAGDGGDELDEELWMMVTAATSWSASFCTHGG